MLEDRYKINTNKTIKLSVQHLLNCKLGNCRAGDATVVFGYAKTRPLIPD